MAKRYSTYDNVFQMLVAWVDHGGTLEDKQVEGVVDSLNPNDGRNYHIGGFRLNNNGEGGPLLTVLIPQEVIGSFKLPQLGDVVWIEESRRSVNDSPRYVYSSYNSEPLSTPYIAMPLPQWGGFANDFGHLRTYRDHVRQFSPTIDGNFVTKYISHITGYRFRKFYRGTLTQGNFANRGDAVFDIYSDADREYLISNGVDIGYGKTLEPDQSKYPNVHNAPATREENKDYTYDELVNIIPSKRINSNQYNSESSSTPVERVKEHHVLKNKNYVSYQPIMDKKYLEYSKFERELPATEEINITLRGNNKLLIQDHYGDGEQLLITLKSQYDEQFTIVHNGDKGQIRLRDNLGQGVLIEGNPDAPRIISWTTANQRVEQGSVKDKGSFTYVRNGDAYGDATTGYGTKTGVDKDNVSNQELLLVSSSEIVGELSGRLSSGMSSLVNAGMAPGMYFRNNIDPQQSEQTYSLYNTSDTLVSEARQAYTGQDGKVETSLHKQVLTGTSATDTVEVSHNAPGTPTKFSEIREATNTSVTRNYVLDYNVGLETIASTESIVAPSTALRSVVSTINGGKIIITQTSDGSVGTITNDILNDSGNQITNVMDVAAPSITTTWKEAGSLAVVQEMAGGNAKTEKYDAAGSLLSTIEQTLTEVNIKREKAGVTINIGADGQADAITIGNATAPLNLIGNTTTLEGSSVVITGDTVNIKKAP